MFDVTYVRVEYPLTETLAQLFFHFSFLFFFLCLSPSTVSLCVHSLPSKPTFLRSLTLKSVSSSLISFIATLSRDMSASRFCASVNVGVHLYSNELRSVQVVSVNTMASDDIIPSKVLIAYFSGDVVR